MPRLSGLTEDDLIREVLLRWKNHKIYVHWMERFFVYLDRYYVKLQSQEPLHHKGVLIFKQLVRKPDNAEAKWKRARQTERDGGVEVKARDRGRDTGQFRAVPVHTGRGMSQTARACASREIVRKHKDTTVILPPTPRRYLAKLFVVLVVGVDQEPSSRRPADRCHSSRPQHGVLGNPTLKKAKS